MGILLESGDHLLMEDGVSHLLLELGYSRGDYATLPIDDAELETAYLDSDVDKLAVDDANMVLQSATDENAIHQFKVDATGRSSSTITWIGQSNIACSVSPAYLQIFDYTLVESEYVGWTTIDSDSGTLANTDFTLTSSIADLTQYKDTNGMVTCRVYQYATLG